MALVTLTTSDNTEVRVDAASVVAVEEVKESLARIHLSSGKTFLIGSSVSATATALGL